MTLQQYINSLYAKINCSRELLDDVLKNADTIQEVAMSAAVSASHLGNHSRIFAEIAHQIHMTADKLNTCGHFVKSEIDVSKSMVLQSVKNWSNVGKYMRALEQVKDSYNRQAVIDCIANLEGDMIERLQSIVKCQTRCDAAVKTLIQIQNRFFAIGNAMRIELVPLPQELSSTLESVIDAIAQLHAQSSARLEELTLLICSIRTLIRNIYQNEVGYYATCQAL